MIEFQGTGQDVARCLDNALLWVSDEARHTPGRLLFSLSDRELAIAGFSDIIIGVDKVVDESAAVGGTVMFELSEEDAHAVIQLVRPRRTKLVVLQHEDGYLTVKEDTSNETYEGTMFRTWEPRPAWSAALTLLERGDVAGVPGYVAFGQEVLTRLGRVKTPGKAAPIDLSFERLEAKGDSYLVHAKVGTTFRAAFTSIRREVVAETLADRAVDSLWQDANPNVAVRTQEG